MALALDGKITRRAVLSATCSLASPSIGVANGAESVLRRAARQGQLRFAVCGALAQPSPSVTAAIAPDPFAAGLARLIAEGLGLLPAIRHDDVPDSMVALVMQDSADIGATPLLAPSTIRRVMFSTPVSLQDMVVLGPGPQRRRGWVELVGLRLGALAEDAAAMGTRGMPLNGLRLFEARSLLQLESWLVGGQVDVAVARETQAGGLRRRNPGVGLIEHFVAATFPIGLVVRQGEHDLLRALNAVLATARRDGRLGALHREHLGRPAPDIDLL